jgi:asparagine synthase (glutamine-hydrolysing)
MCGIAGILKVHPPGAEVPPPDIAIPEHWLDILDDAIKHRGPDGKGRFRDRATRQDGSTVDVALIHRRLAIIDPACGHQPMVSPGTPALRAGSSAPDLIAVVFNGCIYNHRELRRELEAAGHHFQTDHSDTEVLIHGWREWKQSLWSRLDGMFAIALWQRGQPLVLARDQFGEKPLYWARLDRRTIAFASTVPGLLRLLPSDAAEVQSEALANWIRCGFAGRMPLHISEVPNPRAITFDPFEEVVLYNIMFDSPELPVGQPEAVDLLLQSSVAERLDADVPLGCFLSGGVDSSLVAAIAVRQRPDLHTFTVRMPHPSYDESSAAQQTAALLGTRHVTLDCAPDPAQDLTRLIQQLGLPFGDSSLLPTHWVSGAARKHVAVALAGDGGDEMFAGYQRHQVADSLARWAPLIGMLPADQVESTDPRSVRSKAARLIRAARRNDAYELISIFQWRDLKTLAPWVNIADLEGHPVRATIEPDMGAGFEAMIFLDRHEYLPRDLLRKTDTAAMSVALEVRAPMLDQQLTSHVYSLSKRNLMPRGQRKGLLRQVARKYLPAEIVDRPKQGFAIPIGEWFRSDYGQMRQLLLDHLNSTEPFGPPSLGIDLNMRFIQQMIAEHMDRKRDHSQRLYMLLVLSIWAKWLGSLRS